MSSEVSGENQMKQLWADGGAALGLWLSSNNAAGAEILADAGYDYINVDMQHGLIDYNDAVTLLQALTGSASTLTCRVPWNEPGIIGKVLDAGAMGVIVPMVNTVAQAEAAVSACRYAPAGSRSYGPIRAGRLFGADYAARANDEVACIPMIETAEALENLDAILRIQEELLEAADRHEVPIVDNVSFDRSVLLSIRHVTDTLSKSGGLDVAELR